MSTVQTTPHHNDYETIGALTWLAMNSQTHHRLPSGEFMRQLKPALQAKRVHLIARHDEPYAWLAWRHLHETEFASTPAPNGLHGWLDFWVRPYGCDEALAKVVAQTLSHAMFPRQAHASEVLRLHWIDPSTQQLHRNITPAQLVGR